MTKFNLTKALSELKSLNGGWSEICEDCGAEEEVCFGCAEKLIKSIFQRICEELPVEKTECNDCKDLPEGKVVKGHDHRLSNHIKEILL